MGWVDSPKFFCAFSETLTDVANALVDVDLPVPAYGAISALPATEPPPPHTSASLAHIDCYMDDVIVVVQGGAERQHRVFDSTVRALKWLFFSLPGEAKDSVSVKKLLAGEGDWELAIWEGDRSHLGVDGPTEDLLDALPVSFHGQELLDRHRVFGFPG